MAAPDAPPTALTEIEQLYFELDHLNQAEFIITQTIRACADAIGRVAANEPDRQQQRRTTLSEIAHRLRLTTGGHHNG